MHIKISRGGWEIVGFSDDALIESDKCPDTADMLEAVKTLIYLGFPRIDVKIGKTTTTVYDVK